MVHKEIQVSISNFDLTKNIRQGFIIKLFNIVYFFYRFSPDPDDNDCLIEMVILYAHEKSKRIQFIETECSVGFIFTNYKMTRTDPILGTTSLIR